MKSLTATMFYSFRFYFFSFIRNLLTKLNGCVKSIYYGILLFSYLFVFIPAGYSQNTFSKDVIFSINQDGMDISGKVTIASEFVFLGGPYLKVKYSNLTINSVRYQSELFNDNFAYGATDYAKDFIQFPYTFSHGSNKINVEFPIYLGFEVGSEDFGYSCQVDQVNKSKRAFYATDVYGVSDASEVKEVADYFKNLNLTKLSDSDIWECSEVSLMRIKVNSVSPNILSELKRKLDRAIRNKEFEEKQVEEQKAKEKKEQERKEEENELAKSEEDNIDSSSNDSSSKNGVEEKKESAQQEENIEKSEDNDENDKNKTSDSSTNSYVLYQNALKYAREAESRGDYDAAISFYQSAYRISPTNDVAYKIQYLQEMQGAQALAETVNAISYLFKDVKLEERVSTRGIYLGTYKSEEDQREVSLGFDMSFINEFFAVDAVFNFHGHPSRKLDLMFNFNLGVGYGSRRIGFYANVGSGLGGRVFSDTPIDDRLVGMFNYGFRSFYAFNIDGDKPSALHLYFTKFPAFENEKILQQSGYLPDSWSIGVGYGWYF